MPSDIEAVIGTTSALHLTQHSVKIVVVVKEKTGVQYFALDSRPELKAYISTRAFARIVGPIRGSFIGPASADAVVSATTTIVPTDVEHWPKTLEEVAQDSAAINFSISALVPVPSAVVPLSEVINTQIKPRPLSGRHPALLFAWDVETTHSTFRGRFEFHILLELDGVDWVAPASWK